eukprot:scaffold172041_cov29-Attheya_sp.AAC.2
MVVRRLLSFLLSLSSWVDSPTRSHFPISSSHGIRTDLRISSTLRKTAREGKLTDTDTDPR